MTLHDIERLFTERGGGLYFGERVTEAEHALQAAHLASCAGASESLIAAALLHDVGHLLHGDESLASHGIDARHEEGGADWLALHFPPNVSEPARLHVAAKRYLCAVEPAYLAGLSPASILSLRLQGGPMDDIEAERFAAHPFSSDAIALRRWDDGAKVPGLDVPGFAHYRPLLARLMEGA